MVRNVSKPHATVELALPQPAIARSLRSSRPASTGIPSDTMPNADPSSMATSVAAATTEEAMDERLAPSELADIAKLFEDQQRLSDATSKWIPLAPADEFGQGGCARLGSSLFRFNSFELSFADVSDRS